MRDSTAHSRLMLAGMWGGRGGCLPEIRHQVDNWGKYSVPGQNDQFMSEVIYPLTRHQSLCHDSFGHFDDGKPFPPHVAMRETSFVGENVRLDMAGMDVWRRLGEMLDKTAVLNRCLAQKDRELKEANATRRELESQKERELEKANARISELERRLNRLALVRYLTAIRTPRTIPSKLLARLGARLGS
jgi:hypothetical protein